MSNKATQYLEAAALPYVFGFCLVSLTFKQTQVFAGIGPFQILTLTIAFSIIAAHFLARRPTPWGALSVAVAFIAAIAISSIVALFDDPSRISVREVAAYLFVFVCVVAFVLGSRSREADYMRAMTMMIATVLAVLMVVWLVPSPWQSAMRFEGATRFQGLSDNPNQIGFLAAAGLVLALALEMMRQIDKRVLIPAVIAISMAGVLAGSTAFVFGTIFTAVFSAVYWIIAPWRRYSRQIFVAATLPLLVWALVALIPVNAGWSASTGPIVAPLTDRDPNEDLSRILLWSNALAISQEAPIFGYGPGAHIPLEMTGVEAHDRNEAHSTPLDVLVISGAVGLSLLIGLFGRMAYVAFACSVVPGMLLVLSPMAVVFMTHYLGRQPLLWIIAALACGFVPQALSMARQGVALPAGDARRRGATTRGRAESGAVVE